MDMGTRGTCESRAVGPEEMQPDARSTGTRCHYNTKWPFSLRYNLPASPSLVSFFRGGGRAATTSRRGGNNGETPSIVLKSRRTNVRPNSSINLQVNQVADAPAPPPPPWPGFREHLSTPSGASPGLRQPRVYIHVRAYAYIPGRACTRA